MQSSVQVLKQGSLSVSAGKMPKQCARKPTQSSIVFGRQTPLHIALLSPNEMIHTSQRDPDLLVSNLRGLQVCWQHGFCVETVKRICLPHPLINHVPTRSGTVNGPSSKQDKHSYGTSQPKTGSITCVYRRTPVQKREV